MEFWPDSETRAAGIEEWTVIIAVRFKNGATLAKIETRDERFNVTRIQTAESMEELLPPQRQKQEGLFDE